MTERESPLEPFPKLSMDTTHQAWQQFFDLAACPYIPPCDLEQWQEKLNKAEVETVFAFLLVRCPSLESLHVDSLDNGTDIATILKYIAQAHHSLESKTGKKVPLSKLHRVHPLDLDHDASAKGMFETICMLSSMRAIHYVGRNDALDRWPSLSSKSEVTGVEVYDHRYDAISLRLTPESLTYLFNHLTKLETFSYKRLRGYVGFVIPPQEFVRLIEIYYRTQLFEMTLYIDDLNMVLLKKRNFFAGSFRDFANLRVLTLTLGLLIKVENDEYIIPRLIDIMPLSIEEVNIADHAILDKYWIPQFYQPRRMDEVLPDEVLPDGNDDMDEDKQAFEDGGTWRDPARDDVYLTASGHNPQSDPCISFARAERKKQILADLFDGILELKAKRIPNLKLITFTCYQVKIPLPVTETIRAACESVGIELRLRNEGLEHYDSIEELRASIYNTRRSGGDSDDDDN